MRRIAVAMALWLSGRSVAEESGPFPSILLTQIPASNVMLGSLVVTLESATLPDLIEAVGAGVSRHNGRHSHDGGGDEVCYSFPGGLVQFTSNGEMGGSMRFITDVLVDSSAATPAECAALPKRFTPVRVGGWLSLGDGRGSVEQRFGTTAGRSDARVLYEFRGWTPGLCANVDLHAFDIGVSLEITYRGNTVIRIRGSQLTSC